MSLLLLFMFVVTAIADTFIKKTTQQASELPEGRKKAYGDGDQIRIDRVIKTEAGHKLCELAYGQGEWYLFEGHFNGFVSTPQNSSPNDLAGKIISYMKGKGYKVFEGKDLYNIVYIEGMNLDGTLNSDRPNEFNDLRLVIEITNRTPKIIGKWDATTEPGDTYTERPMNPKGAARIEFGQYFAWQVGTHKNHEALVQTGGVVTVCRDLDKNYIRTGDKRDTGKFGINQHWGYDHSSTDIGGASAGCPCGRTRQGHREFMALIKQDNRYRQDARYVYCSTFIAGDDLIGHSPLIPIL